MRKLHKVLLAGAGALLIGGAALAASEKVHVLKVAMPDGSVAQVHYVGDVAPRVVVSSVPAELVALSAGQPFLLFQGTSLDAAPRAPIALADPFWGFDMPLFAGPGPSAFTEIDRMMAAIDARMDAMMRQVAAMQAQAAADPGATRMVSGGDAGSDGGPAGLVRYSYVSTSTSGDGCTTSVQWSSDGSGAEPKVIKTSSGSCGNGSDRGGAPAPVKAATPAPAKPAPAPASPTPIPGASRT
jgi:hypothetical protein